LPRRKVAAAWPFVLAALLFVATACSEGTDNPVLGAWVVDPGQTGRGAVRATETTGMDALTFRPGAIASNESEIAVSYVVEEDRVRAVREDGRGEHLIELLPEERIRVALPIGVTAVYRKAGT